MPNANISRESIDELRAGVRRSMSFPTSRLDPHSWGKGHHEVSSGGSGFDGEDKPLRFANLGLSPEILHLQFSLPNAHPIGCQLDACPFPLAAHLTPFPLEIFSSVPLSFLSRRRRSLSGDSAKSASHACWMMHGLLPLPLNSLHTKVFFFLNRPRRYLHWLWK